MKSDGLSVMVVEVAQVMRLNLFDKSSWLLIVHSWSLNTIAIEEVMSRFICLPSFLVLLS